jgi:hypothetical protein
MCKSNTRKALALLFVVLVANIPSLALSMSTPPVSAPNLGNMGPAQLPNIGNMGPTQPPTPAIKPCTGTWVMPAFQVCAGQFVFTTATCNASIDPDNHQCVGEPNPAFAGRPGLACVASPTKCTPTDAQLKAKWQPVFRP